MKLLRLLSLVPYAMIAGAMLSPTSTRAVEFDFKATSANDPDNPLSPPILTAILSLSDDAYLRGSANASDVCGSYNEIPCNGPNYVNDGGIFFQADWNSLLTFPLRDSQFSFATLGLTINDGMLSGDINMEVNAGGGQDVVMTGTDGVWSGYTASDEGFCFDRCTFGGIWTISGPVPVSEPSAWLLLAEGGLASLYIALSKRSPL
jgi:hypothetical protein